MPVESGPNNNDSALNPAVLEAQERWETCNAWFSDARRNWLEDYKFANADPYNMDQWPNSIRRARDYDDKPVLTTNKVRQHNLEIINKAKKNKAAIKIRPTGNGATFESAQIWESYMRQVQYQSLAPAHYDRALSFMVQAGAGYLRVFTEWAKGQMYQDAKITSIQDPLTVFLDRDAKGLVKEDMNYAMIFEDQDRQEFVKFHPDWAKYATDQALVEGGDWVSSDRVRKCEYFRRVQEKKKLFSIQKEGEPTQIFSEDTIGKVAGAPIIADLVEQSKDPQSGVRMREEEVMKVEWKYIIGNHIVEESVWPGETIPIVPMIAEEVVVDGVYDWKSHTRAMIDPQRMYNFWSSTAVEYGANQTKTPWIAAAQAIENYEVYWNNANRVSNAVLPYNAFMDDGTTAIPPPQRIEPPVPAPVALTGMQIADQEMLQVSGQGPQAMNQEGNERTGAALDRRMDQAETATFHYINAQNMAVARIGKILMEIAPEIMDVQRMQRCLANDGTSFEVMIDPQQKQAHDARINYETQKIQAVLWNPSVGTYDVQVDVGPDYGTRRQEAVNSLTLLLTQAPQLTSIIGDILLRNSDFDQADEAAARLRRMVPPHALGEGPSVSEQQMAQQIQELQKLLQGVMEELSNEKIKVKGKDMLRQVDSFKALTDRLKMLFDSVNKTKQTQINAHAVPGGEGGQSAAEAGVTTKELEMLIAQALKETFNVSLDPVVDATAPVLQEAALAGQDQPMLPGLHGMPRPIMHVGADGRTYARDFSQSSAYTPVS